MHDDDKPKKKHLSGWLRTNYIFLVVTVLLIAAAILSVTYAYKNGRSSMTKTSVVDTYAVDLPSQQPEAETIQEDKPDTDTPSTPNSNFTPQNAPTSQSPTTGSALGESIDCKQIDKSEVAKLLKGVDRLADILRIEVEPFNQKATSLYENYANTMRSKGCKPSYDLNNLLRESGNLLL